MEDLRSVPLFRGIAEAHLGALFATFRPAKYDKGAVLFRPGDAAARLDILTKGEVCLEEESSVSGAVKFTLHPVNVIGELAALTGTARATTATALTDVEVMSVPASDLLGYFDANPAVAVTFYRNLLSVVGDKVRRDRQRIEDMRSNIIRTQKAMKEMRDTVLAAVETPISKPLCDSLETLIDRNRRANYRVTPTGAFPAHVRLDDGRTVEVLELSEGHVKVKSRTHDLTKDPSFWAGVLVVPGDELLLSGSVIREGDDGVVVKLDRPMDDSKAKLDTYTSRIQLLDFVV